MGTGVYQICIYNYRSPSVTSGASGSFKIGCCPPPLKQRQLTSPDSSYIWLSYLGSSSHCRIWTRSWHSWNFSLKTAAGHFFKCCDIDISALAHRKVYLFIKSVSINSTYIPKFKANITISMLDKIISKCDTLRYGCVYKAVFLLAYFPFLRLSNVVPVSAKSFYATRNLLRGDIIFAPPPPPPQVEQVHTILQCPPSSSNTFPLPSPLFPVSALKAILAFVPASASSPFFLLSYPTGLVILISSMVSSILTRIIRSLSLNPANYGFHAFRRSAVSWAADHNVPLQNLKAHGGWSSSAINHYFKHTPKASSTVATTFQQLLLM